ASTRWRHQTLDQATTTHTQATIGVAVHQVFQPVAYLTLFALDLGFKVLVGPVAVQGLSRCHESQVIATEGAVMRAGLPYIQFRTQQNQGHGQTKAGQGFGQGDDVRTDTGLLKTEETASSAATDLNVIDDQQHVVLAAQTLQLTQPALCGNVHAP